MKKQQQLSSEPLKTGGLDAIRTEFKEQQSSKKKTRIVSLYFMQDCTCPGHPCNGKRTDLTREVPWDSSLKDGDQVAEFTLSDKITGQREMF